MSQIEVEKIIEPVVASDGAGVKLKRSIGTHLIDYHDPFLMLDEFGSENKDDYIGGFPPHPHRGIETVTIAYKGKVEHNDSTGAGGVIEEGGIQWMTSGKGILHKEYHEKNFSKKGGDMQMVQLWVNLPAKDKMTEPKYQNIENKDLAKVDLGNGVGSIDIIAGEFENNKMIGEGIFHTMNGRSELKDWKDDRRNPEGLTILCEKNNFWR